MASIVVAEKTDATPPDDGIPVQRWSSEMQRPPAAEKSSPRISDVSIPSTLNNATPFDTDVEAMVSSGQQSNRKSTQCIRGGPDCQVWPGQDHWKRKAKAAKRERRNCNCLSDLSKRNRIIVKVLIGLLIIGIAVAVGVGVSKPLGTGIWHDK